MAFAITKGKESVVDDPNYLEDFYAPLVPERTFARNTEGFVDRIIWQVEALLGPLDTTVCEVEGDDDKSILEHNVRCILQKYREYVTQ